VKQLLAVLPRLGRMLFSLMRDSELPRGAKIALGAMALYLASPVDLIPDFIPFVGYLDDLILAAIVVDGVLNHVDRDLVVKYWPGSVSSLDATAAVARRLSAWVPGRVKARIFGR
jgi:uncharacterized membrane protein YkvA (DUF1232 family)